MIALLSIQAAAPESAAPPAVPAPIVVEGKKEKKAERIIDREQDRQRAVHAYDENAKNGLARQGPQ